VGGRQWTLTHGPFAPLFGKQSKHVRLLVIEDEPRIAEILKTALERAEFAVDTVRFCVDAREALENTAYDAAILDLGLPGGDGLDLIAELRRQNANRIPILVLTARDTVRDRVFCCAVPVAHSGSHYKLATLSSIQLAET
jgi:CheY-like chemotaxis protein